jgi:hypothetical protein
MGDICPGMEVEIYASLFGDGTAILPLKSLSASSEGGSEHD